jgi:hypothetical protein
MSRWFAVLCLTAALAAPVSTILRPAPARADLLLNEVLYDPDGPDDGFEFVELWNPDSTAVSLEGIAVEAGDGARPGSWTPVYIGAFGDSAPPAGAFLIPGSALRASIQNGPDALRLTRAGLVLDLVGYGALTVPELYQGAPAEDAPSGQSLARLRDGGDTGVNAADWTAEPEPTPGRANHPDVRLSIARGTAWMDPEVPWPGDAAILRVGVRNRGRLGIDAARWRLEASIRRGAGRDTAWSEAPVGVGPGVAIAPGDSVGVRCAFLAPAAGRFDLRVLLRDFGGGALVIADTLVVRSRSTAAPLAVNEVAFRDRGAGEWVELIAREDLPDLGSFALSDAGGRGYRIDRGVAPRSARAGEILVLAESPALLRASYALPESLVLGCVGGWPALNDVDGDDGVADRVRIIDPDGIVSDAVPYRAEYAEREGSLERLDVALPSASPGSWSECIDPRAGTPGASNSLHAPLPGGGAESRLLLASPRVLRRRPGAPVAPVVLGFGEVARGARVRVLVHDLLGRVRRHLVDGQRILGEAAFLWDGRDDVGDPVPAGAYVARAETIPDGSEPARRGSLALTVVGR